VCLESPDDTCTVAAGLIALGEGIRDLDQISADLSRTGTDRHSVGRIARALMPFASACGRDGAPEPAIEAGVELIEEEENVVRVRRAGPLKPVRVTTLPYPGYPTDLQAQLVTLLSMADGTSVVSEKIYPDRFMHVAELNRMGADIRKDGASAMIHGVQGLNGADVMASDLRAGAALVMAGLIARGRTVVHRVYHIDRGYEQLERKLSAVGAKIRREFSSQSLTRAA